MEQVRTGHIKHGLFKILLFLKLIYSIFFHLVFILVFDRSNTRKQNFPSTNTISLKLHKFQYLSGKKKTKTKERKPENVSHSKISLAFEEITYPEEGIQGAILHVLSYDHYRFT